jgi:hypothetical protein
MRGRMTSDLELSGKSKKQMLDRAARRRHPLDKIAVVAITEGMNDSSDFTLG